MNVNCIDVKKKEETRWDVLKIPQTTMEGTVYTIRRDIPRTFGIFNQHHVNTSRCDLISPETDSGPKS